MDTANRECALATVSELSTTSIFCDAIIITPNVITDFT